MVLQEIKKQVEKWLELKTEDLKKQQATTKQETQEQIQAIEESYRQGSEQYKASISRESDLYKEKLKQEREMMNHDNDLRVQQMEVMQQTMLATKREIADVLQQQKNVTDQERKALNERETAINSQKKEFERTMAETRDELQRILKKKADASRISELEEEVTTIKRGQNASRLVPMILSIAAITLLILVVVVSIIIMNGKLSANQEKMDSMQAEIDELSITPKPTPTPNPTMEPTPEPTTEPTPDPVVEMLRESLPVVLEWEESDSRLPIENVEILRTYQKDGIFVDIVADKDFAIKEEELFKQSGFSCAIPTAEPTDEATEELKEDVTEEPTEEPTEEATAKATEDLTAEPTGESTQEPTEEQLQLKDPRCIVLETVRLNDQYICIFYVQQNEAKDVDYRDTIKAIETLFNGQGYKRFTIAFINGGYDTIVDDVWNEGKIYPIPVAFVPEELIRNVADYTVESGVWMYQFDEDRFVYVVHKVGWEKNDIDAYTQKLRNVVIDGDLSGVVSQSEDQVVVFFVEDGESWYEELAMYKKAIGSNE